MICGGEFPPHRYILELEVQAESGTIFSIFAIKTFKATITSISVD
jgi:hypothetical protein